MGLTLLGIIGLFLPVLHRILFLFIGLVILSGEYVWALTRMRTRFPRAAARVHEATEKVRGFMRRTPAD